MSVVPNWVDEADLATPYKWQSSWQAAYPPAAGGLPQSEFGKTEFSTPMHRRAFTLVELLVVIAILAFWLPCCCRRFRPRANPPGGRNARTT